MALVKTSKLAAGSAKSPTPAPAPKPRSVAAGRTRAPAGSRHEQAAERIAAAAEELASGLVEATAAAEELRRAMEQIAAGAEEAAGASQEQFGAIKAMASNLAVARDAAEPHARRTETAQTVLAETAAQITTSVRAIERNAERQQASVAVIAELERRAQDIGEITRTVSRISDQTNLLALNAAIEAARAGDHGRGFAVVADEVRALAETSEKSAQDVQSLAETIQAGMREVVRAVTDRGRARRDRGPGRRRRGGHAGGDAPGHGAHGRRQPGDPDRRARGRARRDRSAARRRTGGQRRRGTVRRDRRGADRDPRSRSSRSSRAASRPRRSPGSTEELRAGRADAADGRADRRRCRGAVGDHPGTVRRGRPDHGGGRADQSRLPAAGGGDPADIRGARPDRADGRPGAGRRRSAPSERVQRWRWRSGTAAMRSRAWWPASIAALAATRSSLGNDRRAGDASAAGSTRSSTRSPWSPCRPPCWRSAARWRRPAPAIPAAASRWSPSDIRSLAREASESADRVKDTVAWHHRPDRLGAPRPGADHRHGRRPRWRRTAPSWRVGRRSTPRSTSLAEANGAIAQGADAIAGRGHPDRRRGAADRRGGGGSQRGLAPGRDRIGRAGARRRGPGRGHRGDRLAGRRAEAVEWLTPRRAGGSEALPQAVPDLPRGRAALRAAGATRSPR